MLDVLSEEIQSEELKQCEKKYYKHLYKRDVTANVQFDYAKCLVRSRYPVDVRKGVLLLEELLSSQQAEDRSDSLYYLALGYARLKKNSEALRCIRCAAELDPEDERSESLEKAVRERARREIMFSAALASGAVFLASVLLVVTFKALRCL